jgi:PAS domain S-box-containing protein
MKREQFFDGLSFRITCGLVLALFVVGVPFFLSFYRLHERQMLDGMQKPMTDLSQLILTSLEKRMLEQQPHLLAPDLEDLARETGGARILILDPEGQIRTASEPGLVGGVFSKTDRVCMSCHGLPEPLEQVSFIDSSAGKFARNVLLIRNKPSCRGCHSAGAINGILLVDLPMAPAVARLRSDVHEMLALAGVMVAVTILVLAGLVNRLVVKRIKAFEKTTVAIRNGSLDERVSVRGNDEISRLADSFNVMTYSLRDSLQEIQRNKDYLEKLIDGIEDEIVVVDRSFRVVSANLAYLRNCGHSKPEVVEQSCCANRRDVSCQVGGHCPTGTTFKTGEIQKWLSRFHDSSGHEKFVEIYSYPLSNDSGEVFQAIEVRRDVTERRFLEAHLCHAERLASLGLLASGISHEINNPLASIVTCSEGLEKRVRGKARHELKEREEFLDYLTLISKEAMRAKAITERLLILARKSESSAYLVSVNRSLADTVLLIRFQAADKGVDICEEYDRSMPEIKVDDPGLRQVFLNLLLNALQATESGGRITIQTSVAGPRLHVIIEDTGCGIPPDEIPHLFEPFFSNRPVDRGTGLGLFISNTLVRQMGGRLDVRSQVGKGSVFTTVLPLTSVSRPARGTSRRPSPL